MSIRLTFFTVFAIIFDMKAIRFCGQCGEVFVDLGSVRQKCDGCLERNEIEKRLFIKARKRAKERGLEFSINQEDIVIPDVCPVLGIPLKRIAGERHDGSPSVDRFDNSMGYVPGNIRVISYRANILKSNATADEMVRVARYCCGVSV